MTVIRIPGAALAAFPFDAWQADRAGYSEEFRELICAIEDGTTVRCGRIGVYVRAELTKMDCRLLFTEAQYRLEEERGSDANPAYISALRTLIKRLSFTL